jgi:hypothetical protein
MSELERFPWVAARRLIDEGRAADAVAMLEQAGGLQSEDLRVLGPLRFAYAAVGRLADAQGALLRSAELRAREGFYLMAASECRAALGLHPENHGAIRLKIAEYLTRQGVPAIADWHRMQAVVLLAREGREHEARLALWPVASASSLPA